MATTRKAPTKPAGKAKSFTPAEAMAEATRRARVWASPAKKAAAAKKAAPVEPVEAADDKAGE